MHAEVGLDFVGPLLGVLCVGAILAGAIYLIVRLTKLPDAARIDKMDARIRELSQRIAALEKGADVEPRPHAAPTSPVPPPHVAAPRPVAADVPPPLPVEPSAPPRHVPLPAAATPVATRVVRAAPAKADVSLENYLGGRVMLIVGVIIGLFGVAFFLKFAIDKGWLVPSVRVAMGVAGGVAMLWGGDHLRRRGYDVFGQALMGCGLGALYLSNYFACTRYEFVGETGAFAYAGAITAAGAALAIWRGAPVLAHLGFLGGYLAPALLAKPSGELDRLSTWLLIVDAGVLGVMFVRAWKGLDLIALGASAVYFGAWYVEYGSKAADVATQTTWLALLSAAPLVACVAPAARRRAKPDALSLAVAAGAGILFFGGGYSLLFPARRVLLGVATLALGGIYAGTARLFAVRVAEARDESAAFLGFAIASLAAAIATALSGNAVAPALSAAGVAVVFAGVRTRRSILIAGGLGLVALAFAELLVDRMDLFEQATTPFLSERFAVFVCPCVAMFVCGKLLERVPDLAPNGPSAASIVALWALPVVMAGELLAGTKMSNDPLRATRIAAATAVLAIYGAAVARLYGRDRGAAARALSFGPMALAVVFGLWLLAEGHHLHPETWFTTMFLAGVVLVAACFYSAASAGAPAASETIRVVALLYLLCLLTNEIHAWGEHRTLRIDLTREQAQFAATVWISIAWAIYATALVVVGFGTKRAGLRWFGLCVFALTVCKVFVVDLANLEPVYRIGSFLVLGALLVAASFLYQRARRSDDASAA